MTVSKLRVTASRLLAAIREAAKSSSNVVFIPPPEKRSMAGMMTFLQAMKCLQSGSLVGKPKLNEDGDWELSMERHAANYLFKIRAVAICDGVRVSQIIVLLESSDNVSL